MKVTANRFYRFSGPCLLDLVCKNPADVAAGQVVKVVNKHGCPKANTMGQCYVEDLDGRFLGMVSTSCLENCPQPKKDGAATAEELSEFVRLATGSPINGYVNDGDTKRRFAKLGQKVARLIATKMGLKAGTFDVRYNAGGNAVCGDIMLHGESIYIAFGQMAGCKRFYFRACDGRQDYTGRSNQWMNYRDLRKINAAVAAFKQVAGLEAVAA